MADEKWRQVDAKTNETIEETSIERAGIKKAKQAACEEAGGN
ncbi:MAG TPA: hypothetical protein V6D08_20265 [Candidatus Obscuribacterales bacterium]